MKTLNEIVDVKLSDVGELMRYAFIHLHDEHYESLIMALKDAKEEIETLITLSRVLLQDKEN